MGVREREHERGYRVKRSSAGNQTILERCVRQVVTRDRRSNDHSHVDERAEEPSDAVVEAKLDHDLAYTRRQHTGVEVGSDLEEAERSKHQRDLPLLGLFLLHRLGLRLLEQRERRHILTGLSHDHGLAARPYLRSATVSRSTGVRQTERRARC